MKDKVDVEFEVSEECAEWLENTADKLGMDIGTLIGHVTRFMVKEHGIDGIVDYAKQLVKDGKL